MLYRIINFIKRLFSYLVPSRSNSPEVVIPILATSGDSNITLGTITDATDKEKIMINSAVEIVKEVIRSQYFKEFVLSSPFTNTNGLTNQEIYDRFTQSKITVNVDMFNGTWKQNHIFHTMGFEVENDDFVHINRYFVHDTLTMGSLILHEIAHDPLGFRHESSSERTSVPYFMNTIFDRCAYQLGYVKPDLSKE